MDNKKENDGWCLAAYLRGIRFKTQGTRPEAIKEVDTASRVIERFGPRTFYPRN